MRAPIGPRWLPLIILAFGLLEIPWVIYLLFFQERTGTAQHTHLAVLGLSGGAALLAVMAGLRLWQARPCAAPLSVMTANLYFAMVLSAVPVVAATVVGFVVAAISAGAVLRDPDERPARWQPLVLFAVAAVMMRLVPESTSSCRTCR